MVNKKTKKVNDIVATAKVKLIFSGATDFSYDKQGRIYSFEVMTDSIDFESLVKLSKLLKTKLIDFFPRYVEDCPTCGGTYYQDIFIRYS